MRPVYPHQTPIVPMGARSILNAAPTALTVPDTVTVPAAQSPPVGFWTPENKRAVLVGAGAALALLVLWYALDGKRRRRRSAPRVTEEEIDEDTPSGEDDDVSERDADPDAAG